MQADTLPVIMAVLTRNLMRVAPKVRSDRQWSIIQWATPSIDTFPAVSGINGSTAHHCRLTEYGLAVVLTNLFATSLTDPQSTIIVAIEVCEH
jgi:hypothetical protein